MLGILQDSTDLHDLLHGEAGKPQMTRRRRR